MKYFTNCKTLDELKAEYRCLADDIIKRYDNRTARLQENLLCPPIHGLRRRNKRRDGNGIFPQHRAPRSSGEVCRAEKTVSRHRGGNGHRKEIMGEVKIGLPYISGKTYFQRTSKPQAKEQAKEQANLLTKLCFCLHFFEIGFNILKCQKSAEH